MDLFLFQKFEDDTYEVKRKDGILLLRELASEVKNFLDFKKNAVMVKLLLIKSKLTLNN